MFVPGQNQLLANLSLLLFLRIFRSFVFMILKRTFEECVSLFSYQRSFFALPFVSNSFAIISCCFLLVKKFFQLFWSCFCFSLAATLIFYHIRPAVVKNFFISFYSSLSDATRLCYHESFQMSRTFFISFHQRRRRDLNPRAATNDLLPFQGSPFSRLGTSAWLMLFAYSQRPEAWQSLFI